MKPLLVLIFSFLSIKSAQAASACSDILTREGVYQINRFQADDGDCFFGIDHAHAPDNMKYRSFLLVDDGLFMVFNSYNPNMGSTDHGARVYFFFPRGKTPSYTMSGKQIKVQTAAPGIEIFFHTDRTKIAGMNGGVIKESSSVSPSNNGGVELSGVKTLYLDAGYRQGQDPTADPKRSSTFIDSKGRKCVVENFEIFNYSADGDSTFRFSDRQLKTWLKDRCSQLKVNF